VSKLGRLMQCERRWTRCVGKRDKKFELMNTNMAVLTATLSTHHSQLQNTMHALLSQREEKMISNKAHAIDMRMFDLERHKRLFLPLLLPPSLTNPSMPPPTPSTPTTQCNNIQPPSPAPTPLASNGKRAVPMAEEPSPTKRLKAATVQTRTSPRNL